MILGVLPPHLPERGLVLGGVLRQQVPGQPQDDATVGVVVLGQDRHGLDHGTQVANPVLSPGSGRVHLNRAAVLDPPAFSRWRRHALVDEGRLRGVTAGPAEQAVWVAGGIEDEPPTNGLPTLEQTDDHMQQVRTFSGYRLLGNPRATMAGARPSCI